MGNWKRLMQRSEDGPFISPKSHPFPHQTVTICTPYRAVRFNNTVEIDSGSEEMGISMPADEGIEPIKETM